MIKPKPNIIPKTEHLIDPEVIPYSSASVSCWQLSFQPQWWIYFSLTRLQVTLWICKHSRKAICWSDEWIYYEAVIGPESNSSSSTSSPFTALFPQRSTSWLWTIKKGQIYSWSEHSWSVAPRSVIWSRPGMWSLFMTQKQTFIMCLVEFYSDWLKL